MAMDGDERRLSITVAGYPYDRVEGLGGIVPIEGCDVRFETASIGEVNSDVLDGPRTRETLTALLGYSHEQGLTHRALSVDESFHPSTLELNEAP